MLGLLLFGPGVAQHFAQPAHDDQPEPGHWVPLPVLGDYGADTESLNTHANQAMEAWLQLEDPEGLGWTERVCKLPRHWRAVYTIDQLDIHICSAGLDLFFVNFDGDLKNETLEDLILIATTPHIPILEKALAIYTPHPDGDEELPPGINESDRLLAELDARYFAEADRTTDYFCWYMAKHIGAFRS